MKTSDGSQTSNWLLTFLADPCLGVRVGINKHIHVQSGVGTHSGRVSCFDNFPNKFCQWF